ncbi:MAG: DNA/RNA non-specific endonuclease [Acidobacteria bacterium]|nr:DNA/RNA non-specific endonuclease [Acidobacteriota bacterium]
MEARGLIAQAASARIRQASEERRCVLETAASSHPLDAEPDEIRKVDRIQTVTGVGRREAERLVRYEAPESFGLTGEAKLGAERIQGRTTDYVGVSFLESALAAAGTVGRIVFRNLQPQGSGFMISDHLFLTNNHVIRSAADAGRFLVEFSYELDFKGTPKEVTRFEFAPQVFFLTNSENELDFTLVAVGNRVGGSGVLSDFGYCPMLGTDDKHVLGEFVNVIQHPQGDYKQVVIRENQLVTRFDNVLHYVADTEPGSSGSPVFNDQWEAIALHHWGEPFTLTTDSDGRPVRKDVNEGVRISAIVRTLMTANFNLSASARALLNAVLSPQFRSPSKLLEGSPRPGPVSDSRDRAVAGQPVISSDGTATWTIPLEVSVRLGGMGAGGAGQQEPGAGVDEEPAPVSEAVQIDRNYSNRRGYNPNFLPGHAVPLPRLNASQRAIAARRLNVHSGQDPFELKYQHFSLVMNAERRMAFFTAANIDGATWINIDRDTGEPREDAEATEVWFDDPRIRRDAQCNQSLYDRQRPRRVFDRGHLVRRQDPAWGTPARAKKANADTFHFTNCSPQESRFNQQVRYWQGIESYVLDNAKAEREKVTVLTGPVFAEDDPRYRFVNVPLSFWKILVRVENGQLLATAMLAEQSRLLPPSLPENLSDDFSEDFDDTSRIDEYQTTVAEIEHLTGLDFGELRNRDTFQPGPEESLPSRRSLASFDDISLDPEGYN